MSSYRCSHSDFSSAEYCHEPEAATSDTPAAPTTIAKSSIRPNREDVDLMLDSSQPASAAAGGPPTGGVNTAFPASQLRVMRPRGDTVRACVDVYESVNNNCMPPC